MQREEKINNNKLDEYYNNNDHFIKYAEDLIAEIYVEILSLRSEIIDKAQGITSSLEVKKDGSPIWKRFFDGETSLINAKSNYLDFNYLRIFYTYIISALTLSKIYEFYSVAFIQNINNIKNIRTKNFINAIELEENIDLLKIIEEGKGEIIKTFSIFSNISDEIEIDKMLDLTKNWASLAEPTLTVKTIIQSKNFLDGKKVIITDEPCEKLTEKQLNEINDYENAPWYKNLSDLEKKLFIYYKDNIKSGFYTIPSRLRSTLPFLKNAYWQTIMVNNKVINSIYHNGTVAYLNDKDEKSAISITQETLLQQKLNARTDSVLEICLNSGASDRVVGTIEWLKWKKFKGEDSIILNLTNQAAANLKEENILYSKLCLNGFRGIEWHDYSGIDKMIALIQENLPSREKNETTEKINSHIKEIHRIKSSYTLLHFSEVQELDLLYHLSKAIYLNNKLISAQDNKLKTAALFFGCASGENRTGISYYHILGMSLIDYQKDMSPKNLLSEKEIFTLLTNSQHIQVMTGGQGSVLGTEGIRYKSSGSAQSKHDTNYVGNHADLKDVNTIPLKAPITKSANSNWSIGNYFWWGTKKTDDSKQEPEVPNVSNLNN